MPIFPIDSVTEFPYVFHVVPKYALELSRTFHWTLMTFMWIMRTQLHARELSEREFKLTREWSM